VRSNGTSRLDETNQIYADIARARRKARLRLEQQPSEPSIAAVVITGVLSGFVIGIALGTALGLA